jgi:hypothetical protein
MPTALSEPVIGADRTLYINRGGSLVAIREAGWLPAPTGVRATPGDGRVTVEWTDNATDETAYVVELCGTDGLCFQVGEVPPDTTRLVARRLPFSVGEPFFARVRADGHAGAPPESGNAELTGASDASVLALSTNHASGYGRSEWTATLPSEPQTVDHLDAEGVAADQVRVTWSYGGDIGHVLAFEIRRSTEVLGPYTPVGAVSASETAFVDRELQPGTEYHYQVVPTNESGSAAPKTVSATTLLRNLPAPADLTVRYWNDSFLLHWSDESGSETGFVVERRGPGQAWFEVVGVLDADNEWFLDTMYVDPGSYDYRVKAVNETSESVYTSRGARTWGGDIEQIFLPFSLR